MSATLNRLMWLSIAAAITTIALKTAAWRLTGSVGLLSDALESLVNLLAAVVGMALLRWSASPPDRRHMNGHASATVFSPKRSATSCPIGSPIRARAATPYG